MIKGKNTIRNLLLAFVTALMAGCNNAPSDLCITTNNNFVYPDRANVKVYARGEGTFDSSNNFTMTHDGWLYTGIEVESGKEIEISSLGEVDLCVHSVPATQAQTVVATENGWFDTGADIPRGAQFQIEVTGGSYSLWSRNWSNCIPRRAQEVANGKVFAENCFITGGMGLIAHLGTTAPENSTFVLDFSENNQTQSLVDTNTLELYNYTPGASNPSLYTYTPSTANDAVIWGNNSSLNLYFRYYDPGGYSDNRGQYNVSVTYPADCTGEEGQYLVGWIGDNPTGQNINTNTGPNIINVDPAYNSNPVPGKYTGTTPESGKLWLKIIDHPNIAWSNGRGRGDNDYTIATSSAGSNTGSYEVNIVVQTSPPGDFTGFLNSMISPVKDILRGSYDTTTGKYEGGLTKIMYNGITGNITEKGILGSTDFADAVRAALALSIVFMGFHYMLGLSNINQQQLFNYILKVSIVIILIGPNSWQFFYDHLFSLFIEGTDELTRLMTSHFLDEVQQSQSRAGGTTPTPIVGNPNDPQGSIFAFADATLDVFFQEEAQMKLKALLLSFPIGFLLGIVIYIGIFMFIFAVIKAALMYLISILMVSLLLFLAPIFISFILFEKTRGMFDNWIKQLMSFSLQPILIFTLLAIFNILIYSVFVRLMAFNVCYQCVWELDLPLSELMLGIFGNFDKFCVFSEYLPWGSGGNQEAAAKIAKTPLGLFVALIFILICHAMISFLGWIEQLAMGLTSGIRGISTGGMATSAMADASVAARGIGQGAATAIAPVFETQAAKYVGRGLSRAAGRIKRAGGKAGGHVLAYLTAGPAYGAAAIAYTAATMSSRTHESGKSSKASSSINEEQKDPKQKASEQGDNKAEGQDNNQGPVKEKHKLLDGKNKSSKEELKPSGNNDARKALTDKNENIAKQKTSRRGIGRLTRKSSGESSRSGNNTSSNKENND